MLINLQATLSHLRVETNVKNVARDIKKISDAPKDLRTYFKKIAVPKLELYFREIFETRGFTRWAPSLRERRGVGKTLIRTGRLYRSYTQSGSPDNITKIRKKNFEFESTVPYARFHEILPDRQYRPVVGTVIGGPVHKRGFIQRSFARSLNLYLRKKIGLR